MPVSIPYTFEQTSTSITIEVELPLSASSSSTPDLVLTPLFLKLSAPPALLTLDLSHAVLPHSGSVKRHLQTNGRPRFTLQCDKETAGQWSELEWKGTRKERDERRRLSLQWWEEEEERKKKARSEQRRQERKEDREKGWEWQRQQKEQILAAKGRERVVALDDLKAWQEQKGSGAREVWEAKPGETIEVIEEDDEQRGDGERRQHSKETEEKEEERKYPLEEEESRKLQPQRTPVAASSRPAANPPPPVRSATRLTTTFTAVHPSLPSLPARESNVVKADMAAPNNDVVSNLLQLKDKADAFYKRKDLHSAVSAYTQLLDEGAIRGRGGDSAGEWRYGWVTSRVLSNRSACYLALATRTGVAALAQQLTNVRLAEDDATEALAVLRGVKSGEASDVEGKALEEKLHKRLVTLYSMQGRWEQALQHAQAAEMKEEMATVGQSVEAVRRGDDVRAQQEAEQQLSRSPPPLLAALRRLNTALTLSPLSHQALQVRVDVYGRLGEWQQAVRDAVLGASLSERSQQSEQRLWWIGRRAECHIALKQFASAQSDLHLLSSATTPYTPLTASSLPVLLSSLSYQQRHHALLASLPGLRSSSSFTPLKSALAALLSLQSSAAAGVASDEWMLGQVELVSEQGWCELKLQQHDACIATCSRAQAMWRQWTSRPKPVEVEVVRSAVTVEDEDEREERARVLAVESKKEATGAERLYRWCLLTSVRLATALCYVGRLSAGRAEYGRVLELMDARKEQLGAAWSEENSDTRRQVEADVAKIDALVVTR